MNDPIVIDFGHGTKVQAAAGTSVLDACQREGLELAHACDGEGRCTTCRVLVEEGHDRCPEPEALEREALSANGLDPNVRLACQLRPEGDIRVKILIPTHDGSPADAPEVREEEIAAVFTDIRGFTTFAEGRLPFDVSTVLNRYFDTMGVHVERHDGIVMDYLGDGLVSVFRPMEGASPERRALSCALDMRGAAHKFGAYVREHFAADLAIGIAIHAGPAVVGEMGYFRNRQFNAVGDVLNVTSRLEDLNKECETDLLISERVAKECEDLARFGREFDLPIRGRAGTLKAVEVLGRKLASD